MVGIGCASSQSTRPRTDVQAAGREAFERGPGPAGVATTEVDARRSDACQVEDPRRCEPPATHEVDHRGCAAGT